MRSVQRLFFLGLALCSAACASSGASGGASQSRCIAQATATYDFVSLVRLRDDTLWVAPADLAFARVDGNGGALHATDIAASGSSAYGNAIGCAIVAGGVWCFPLAGTLLDSTDLGAGLGSGVTTTSARQVVTAGSAPAPLSNVVQISGGMNGGGASFCAVTGDGNIWCWGYNPSGLLAYDDVESFDSARPLLQRAGAVFGVAVEVRVGFGASCARTSDGSVWCWGDNTYQQLGVAPADLSGSISAVLVTLPGAATRLTASPGNTLCAVLEDTSVVCWGRNEYGEAGAPGDRQAVGPTVVRGADGTPLLGAQDLAPDRGMKAMCANTGTAGLQCWGDPNGPAASVVVPGSAASAISAPLSAFGARDGKLVYVDAQGRLVFGAGSLPSAQQPPCP